jgi:hypothetical protein
MNDPEYLVGYGVRGEFGRFRAPAALTVQRGDRVVVRGPRGVEIGTVLRPATRRHAALLPDAPAGTLLRVAGPDDEAQAERLGVQAGALLERAGRLAAELGLPLEPLDAELLLDGEHAVLHHLRWDDADLEPFARALEVEYRLHLTLSDLTGPREEAAGCGSCGTGGHGCGDCGSGGCGACGSVRPDEVQEYFAGLRQKMEQRLPLL